MIEPPKKDDNQIGNVVLPPSLAPTPSPGPDVESALKEEKSLYEEWWEHQSTRRQLFNQGVSEEEINKRGFQAMTFDQYKKLHGEKKTTGKTQPTKEDLEKMSEEKQRRMAGLRLAKNLEAFHNQGVEASTEGFELSKNASILRIDTESLT